MGVTASMSRRQNFVLNPDLKSFLLVSFHSSQSTKLGTCGREENRRRDEMKRSQIFRIQRDWPQCARMLDL